MMHVIEHQRDNFGKIIIDKKEIFACNFESSHIEITRKEYEEAMSKLVQEIDVMWKGEKGKPQEKLQISGRIE